MTEPMPACKICGNSVGNTLYTVREMMFGTREEFEYLECAQCGCVQLWNVPADLSPYYPPDYYSFEAGSAEQFGLLRDFVRKQKHSYCLQGKNPLGKMLTDRARSAAAFFVAEGRPGKL